MNAGSGEADDADAIDQESVLPYYHQLKRILRTRIARDGLNEGDRLWSDREVGDRYGVSRRVVRQAMAELESEGVLHRVKGKGTFLAPAKIDHGLALSLQGLFAHARSQGHTLKSEILRQEIAPMDEHAAAILEVPAGSPGFVLERIRRVDGEPWAHTITWIPAGRVPGIEKEDFTSSSLYQCLTDVHGIAFGQASRSIEAVPASEDVAAALDGDVGAPILRMRSTLRDADGVPVETFIAHHRGDRSRFDVLLGTESDIASLHLRP